MLSETLNSSKHTSQTFKSPGMKTGHIKLDVETKNTGSTSETFKSSVLFSVLILNVKVVLRRLESSQTTL